MRLLATWLMAGSLVVGGVGCASASHERPARPHDRGPTLGRDGRARSLALVSPAQRRLAAASDPDRLREDESE